MDDMVEKIARALWPEFDELPIDASQPKLARPGSFGMTQEVALEKARAAIEAMREPTEAMRSAVEAEESRMGHIMYETITWHQAWPIAIDAALGSKGE